MVKFEISGRIDPLLTATLERGDMIHAESNAMVSMDACLKLQARAKGGFFGALTRKVTNSETLFQQEIVADESEGSVTLSPVFPGDIAILSVDTDHEYLLSDGAYMASTRDIDLTTQTQSIGKALFSKTGGLFLTGVSGFGQCVICGFGSIREIDLHYGQSIYIDNGHLVAWDKKLDYELTVNTAKGSFLGGLVESQMTGEGIVLQFNGEGKIYTCSRNRTALLDWFKNNLPFDEKK